MKFSDIPGSKFPIPFANNAAPSYIRPIPEASQIGIQDGAASLSDGFVPDNFIPEAAGGVPPFGQDFNGLMNQSTAWTRWANAGAPMGYDATFSTDIGGYPAGAILAAAAANGSFWVSTTDDNTTDPDAGGAGWRKFSPGKLPTRQTFTSGSGTYSRPDDCIRIVVTMVGGGGGGRGDSGDGGAGGSTIFNSIEADHGNGGVTQLGGNGGFNGAGAATARFPGSAGGSGQLSSATGFFPGGVGGNSIFLGGGANTASGNAARANSGSGAAGVSGSASSGGGGGGGEGVVIVINNPAASYSYTVGAAGAGGAGGGSAGGAGRIIVEEFYN